MKTGRYPYGAAITRDGEKGLVSNEADGTVSVIDLASASEEKEITVGPHLSHPEGMATDPKADRVYVAVTHQDLVRSSTPRRWRKSARSRSSARRGSAPRRSPSASRRTAGG